MKRAALWPDHCLPAHRSAAALARPGGTPRRHGHATSGTPRPPRPARSRRSTCTASAARRRTGPTWPACSPTGSTARRSTCPASGAASRGRATPSPPSPTGWSAGSSTPAGGRCTCSATRWAARSRCGSPALRPDLVRTLTLVSPGPAVPGLPAARCRGGCCRCWPIPRAERLAAWRLAQLAPEAMARQVMEACVADLTRISEQRRQEAMEEIRVRYEAAHYAAAYVRTFRGPGRQFPALVPAGVGVAVADGRRGDRRRRW